MAKIIKVKMNRVQNGNRIHNDFPVSYDPKKVKVLAYEDLDDVNKEYCIGVIADEDLASFTASSDIEEIDQATANTLGLVWRPQVNRITNQQKILAILDKVHNSTGLSLTDQDAIDPDNAEPGVNKSALFTDSLSYYLTQVG
jgi:hypothetical protein